MTPKILLSRQRIQSLFVHVLILSLMVISQAGKAGIVTRTYYFSHPQIRQSGQFSTLAFEGTSLFGVPGRPVLPFQPVLLLLPPGESADSIALDYKDPVTLPGSFVLMPGQTYRPLSHSGEPEFLYDEAAYSSGSPYPRQLQCKINTGFMNGYSLALSAFTPVTYISSEGMLTYFERVKVTVYSSRDDEAATALGNFRNSENIAKRVAALAQNPEMAASYVTDANPPRTGDYRYLVITSSTFAAQFDTLLSFYDYRGIPTRCYTLSYIDTTAAGSDQQARIREFIHEEYLDHGVEYVLLGGDAEIIPYRGFYCYVVSGSGYSDSNIPADLYYSALDGTWNADNDNLFGEVGEEDEIPDVAIGRLTFSNAAELQRMIHKVTTYQQNPVVADLDRPLLAGEYLWGNPLTYGSDYLNLLIGYQTYNGYVTDGIPETDDIDSLYDEYGQWTKQQLLNEINAGRSYIHHVGHANTTYAMRLYNSDITNANFSQVNGTTHGYPIVYTHGCYCGAFDASDCILEMMLGIDNFASGIVGNSRYGWFVEGTQDGPSQHLHREFVDALYSDSLYRIGMAHMVSKAEMAPFLDLPDEYEPGAHRWCFYDCNVLGDPAMALWTAAPHALAVNCPPMIAIGAEEITVSASFNTTPQKAVVFSFFQGDSLLAFGESGTNGQCTLDLNGTPVEGPATLVVSGLNVSRFEIPVSVADYWLGESTDWNDPQNWFTGQVPDATTEALIPASPSGSNFPNLDAGSPAHCKAIFLEPGASLHLSQNDSLILYGN
jgi:hypothetical protein